MKFFLKIHQINNQKVITICDENLLNKEFKENELILKIDEPYFGGTLKDFSTILELIKEKNQEKIIHAVGSEISKKFIEENIIEEENLNYIADIPYFMILISNFD